MNLNTELLSPNKQLDLLKRHLDSFEFSDDPWSQCRRNGRSVKPEIINFIYEKPKIGKILKATTLKLLDFGVENVISILADDLIHMWCYSDHPNSSVINVLAPSAMEDGSYLGYTFFANSMRLSGEACIYIEEEKLN